MIIANLKNIKIVMGLGNPGKEYEKTRHNAGTLLLNQILNIKNQNDKLKFKNADYFEYFKINNILFVKSRTYMNESGLAVKAAIGYFKAKPEEILIIHDDSDIEAGKYKISFNRGAAGHRGAESIIKSLKTKSFWRLRIGIRPKTRTSADINADKRGYSRKSAPRKKAGEFVLKNFNREELENLKKLSEDILTNLRI